MICPVKRIFSLLTMIKRLAPDKSQIDTESITNETQEAVSLLEDLQSQHESVRNYTFLIYLQKKKESLFPYTNSRTSPDTSY